MEGRAVERVSSGLLRRRYFPLQYSLRVRDPLTHPVSGGGWESSQAGEHT